MGQEHPHWVVVGGGISGLSAAWHLRGRGKVTLLEADHRLGGHTHTRSITIDSITAPVDTGFIVFNHKTYPELLAWFNTLLVPTHPAEMSFSVSAQAGRFEWAGHSLKGLFAQPSNMLRPTFWRMLADILRFNRRAPRDLRQIEAGAKPPCSLGAYLQAGRYSRSFEEGYLLPMAGAIWSCPADQMRAFPFESFTRFCVNHGLLQVTDRPQWFSVLGGSHQYIDKLIARCLEDKQPIDCRTDHVVAGVASRPDGLKTVTGLDRHTGEPFEIVADGVILASHTNQSGALLEAAGHPAAAFLNDFRYEDNTAYLHTDTRLMPRRRAAWAAWNYQATELPLDPLGAPLGGAPQRVSVTYWMNVLQSLPFQTPILVSLNPERAPALSHQLETIRYAHPVFDQAALAARQTIQGLQGHDRVWFAGAWIGYGFHEDGFRSGREAAQSMLAWHEACASEEGSRLAA